MNDPYKFLLLKLRTMQIQGYPIPKILEALEESKQDVLDYLGPLLLISILTDDNKSVVTIQNKITKVENLEKTINIGLLE